MTDTPTVPLDATPSCPVSELLYPDPDRISDITVHMRNRLRNPVPFLSAINAYTQEAMLMGISGWMGAVGVEMHNALCWMIADDIDVMCCDILEGNDRPVMPTVALMFHQFILMAIENVGGACPVICETMDNIQAAIDKAKPSDMTGASRDFTRIVDVFLPIARSVGADMRDQVKMDEEAYCTQLQQAAKAFECSASTLKLARDNKETTTKTDKPIVELPSSLLVEQLDGTKSESFKAELDEIIERNLTIDDIAQELNDETPHPDPVVVAMRLADKTSQAMGNPPMETVCMWRSVQLLKKLFTPEQFAYLSERIDILIVVEHALSLTAASENGYPSLTIHQLRASLLMPAFAAACQEEAVEDFIAVVMTGAHLEESLSVQLATLETHHEAIYQTAARNNPRPSARECH